MSLPAVPSAVDLVDNFSTKLQSAVDRISPPNFRKPKPTVEKTESQSAQKKDKLQVHLL